MSVKELAAAISVTPMAVRHHLVSLQAAGLVTSVEQTGDDNRKRVGRPTHYYLLTQAGFELFPHKYVQLSGRLLDEIKATMPSSMIKAMFNHMAEERASEILPQLQNKSLKEKLQTLVELLSEEGFAAKWNNNGEQYHIAEYNCPYFIIGQRHPEVCNYDTTLISTLLAMPVPNWEHTIQD